MTWPPAASPPPAATTTTITTTTATMPNSVLWAVDLFGKVYTLSTAGQYWELCKDNRLEFKRVSAAMQCCWGIACDNQVYVYVCASDVPIRRREEAYENQVGPPSGGWCPGKSGPPPSPPRQIMAESHVSFLHSASGSSHHVVRVLGVRVPIVSL